MGYLEFLKQVKREVGEALKEEATKRGCSEKEIIDGICKEFKKTLAKLIDEYNWWIVHYGV